MPTRDIHMKQVGLHETWLNFLYEYVGPLQEHVFIGYNTSVRTKRNEKTISLGGAGIVLIDCTIVLYKINAPYALILSIV